MHRLLYGCTLQCCTFPFSAENVLRPACAAQWVGSGGTLTHSQFRQLENWNKSECVLIPPSKQMHRHRLGRAIRIFIDSISEPKKSNNELFHLFCCGCRCHMHTYDGPWTDTSEAITSLIRHLSHLIQHLIDVNPGLTKHYSQIIFRIRLFACCTLRVVVRLRSDFIEWDLESAECWIDLFFVIQSFVSSFQFSICWSCNILSIKSICCIVAPRNRKRQWKIEKEEKNSFILTARSVLSISSIQPNNEIQFLFALRSPSLWQQLLY